ncbi:MAG: TonB-dependent receptor [Tannerella sp.]|jgi:outer membrane receptor protein involved in Fe transport|nr:TonB-dependent receptor [Tannerella sp.]
MKKIFLLLSLFIIIPVNGKVSAEEKNTPQDTVRIFNMDEVVVISSSKETNKMRTLPGSVSLLSPQQIYGKQVTSIKDISSFVPNLYIPDYGAKLTSAVYIRGVGARSSGQSIGLYVDETPYMDKSSFDFELTDIQRIEVLRGPQGTLYGRNAMGGIINIYTLSPFDYQGVKASLSYGNYGQANAKISVYNKPNDKLGLSLGAYYSHRDGFFTNTYNSRKADYEDTAGGNMKLYLILSSALTASYSVSYEHTGQGAFPYGFYHEDTKTVDKVNINDKSSYERSLLSNNLSLRYQNENISVTSTTGYQYLNDDMKMDQDFSDSSLFILNQLQKQHTFTEEISVKSKNDNNYQWSFGVHGFYNKSGTDGPVEFKEDGIKTILQPVFDKLNDYGMPGKLTITNESLYIPGDFGTPSFGTAIYHQSTCNNLLSEGLSITAGIRLDYEKQELTYHSEAKMNLHMQIAPGRPPIDLSESYPASIINEKISQEFRQVLPKISLKYECTPRTFAYLSIAKGYKAGGYNVQMSADIMQRRMQFDVMNSFKQYMPPSFEITEPQPVKEVISYRPETSWNYETGMKSMLIKDRLRTEVTLFYMDIRDLQITKFVESGNGRYLSNAGKAESYGAELSLSARLSDKLTADLNYGYTHATFLDYNNAKENYKGKYIPYTPRHTLSTGLQYNRPLRNCLIDRITASAQCNGTGKIYWTEENSISHPFYVIVNAQAGVHKGRISLYLWTKNLTDTDYSTFYFESLNKPCMQKGKPLQFGARLNITL